METDIPWDFIGHAFNEHLRFNKENKQLGSRKAGVSKRSVVKQKTRKLSRHEAQLLGNRLYRERGRIENQN